MLGFKNLRLKSDIKKIQILFIWVYSLVLLTIFVELFVRHISFFDFIFKMILANIFLQLTYQTIKKLYYSFWSLSGLLFFYLINGLVESIFYPNADQLLTLYTLILIFFSLVNIMLFTPIYYPLIRWWDFKKYCLPVKVHFKNNNNPEDSFNSRLTDVRSLAGCLLSFKNLPINQEVVIEKEIEGLKEEIIAKIISKREYSFGRGHYYGIEFKIQNDFDRKRYDDFRQNFQLSLERKPS
jgi:hypothetical protein